LESLHALISASNIIYNLFLSTVLLLSPHINLVLLGALNTIKKCLKLPSSYHLTSKLRCSNATTLPGNSIILQVIINKIITFNFTNGIIFLLTLDYKTKITITTISYITLIKQSSNITSSAPQYYPNYTETEYS